MLTPAEQILAVVDWLGTLEKATGPEAWTWHPTGLLPESMAALSILGSHNHTPYVSHAEAIFITEAKRTLPALLAAVRELTEELRGYASLPDGAYHGPDDIYESLGAGARESLARTAALLRGGDVKFGFTFNWSREEHDTLEAIAKQKSMTATAVLRQALRLYHALDKRLCAGERLYFKTKDGTFEPAPSAPGDGGGK